MWFREYNAYWGGHNGYSNDGPAKNFWFSIIGREGEGGGEGRDWKYLFLIKKRVKTHRADLLFGREKCSPTIILLGKEIVKKKSNYEADRYTWRMNVSRLVFFFSYTNAITHVLVHDCFPKGRFSCVLKILAEIFFALLTHKGSFPIFGDFACSNVFIAFLSENFRLSLTCCV